MRIFVPLLFVFLLQNLFLFRCWCCCQHHSSQQAVSVSRCSYSKTRAFYSFYLLLFAFLQRRSFIRSLVFTEEQKNRRNLNEQRTRFEFLFFSITQRSQHNVLLNNSIKTDFTGDKSVTTNTLFLPPPLLRAFVLLKECAEQTRISLLLLLTYDC